MPLITPSQRRAALEKISRLTPEQKLEFTRQVHHRLWHAGDVSYKFHATQAAIFRSLNGSKERQFFLLCSRRLGKTYMLLALAFMTCLRKAGARVLFLAPQARDAAEIATDTAAQLMADSKHANGEPLFGCPAALRNKIEYKAQAKEFHFPNGAILRLKGVNAEQADSLRGGATDLVILDEAGQMDNLDYIVKSVVLPMTLTTGGRILFATTPPVTPDHESKIIYDRLFELGATVKFTIRDAPHVPEDAKAEMLRELGERDEDIPAILAGEKMPKTTAALRELFAEFVTDASMRVVPEFTLEVKRDVVKVVKPPAYFDTYVAMDPGFNDRTGILFAYYDWNEGNIVVQSEALLHKASTSDIAKTIAETEYKLWKDDHPPHLRVSDVDPRLIKDLQERHGLVFMAADKQQSLAAVNLVRTMVLNREIVIDSSCVQLVHQLENTIWNRKATDFERTTDGHGDLLAALKYLCRHVNRYKNPYPPGYRERDRPVDEFRSPRKRFWAARTDHLATMGGSTPFAKRVRRRRRGDTP